MPYSCSADNTVLPPAASQSVGASFAQFLFSGGICFVLGTALLYLLTDICKIHYLLSMLIGCLITNALGYWLNRRFAFRERTTNFWRGLVRYYIVNAGALALNLALMAVCVSLLHISYLIASVGLSALLAASNFVIHRNWSFGTR